MIFNNKQLEDIYSSKFPALWCRLHPESFGDFKWTQKSVKPIFTLNQHDFYTFWRSFRRVKISIHYLFRYVLNHV